MRGTGQISETETILYGDYRRQAPTTDEQAAAALGDLGAWDRLRSFGYFGYPVGKILARVRDLSDDQIIGLDQLHTAVVAKGADEHFTNIYQVARKRAISWDKLDDALLEMEKKLESRYPHLIESGQIGYAVAAGRCEAELILAGGDADPRDVIDDFFVWRKIFP